MCASSAGALATRIGTEEISVRALAAASDVDVANTNAPGQIVISGERAKVEAAIGMAKEHGVRRATLLNVAGAYHSRLMESAYQKLGVTLRHITVLTPRSAVLSNATRLEATTRTEIRK